MLKELLIENLAIIEKLDIEIGRGLIALTGETGAGKSIILSGVNLLLGEKTKVDILGTEDKPLVAQGIFSINENQKKELLDLGIEVEDQEIIIRRIIEKTGRTKVFVNGVRISLGSLKEIMRTLVDIVGQHSHQMLLNKENHIKLIDKFSEEEAIKIRKELENNFSLYNEVNKKIKYIEDSKKDLAERKEFYEFQLQEINNAELTLGEDEELQVEYKRLFNAGKIKEKLMNSELGLKNEEINALSIIHTCKKNLEIISSYGKEFEDIYEQIERIYYELDDCVSSIENLNSEIDIDESRLSEVIERLDLLKRLKDKYGKTVEDVLNFKNDIEKKLNKLDENEFKVSNLINKRCEYKEKYWVYAKHLRELREKYIKIIEKELIKELEFLNMKNVNVKIKLEPKEVMSKNGSDSVEIFISTNIGQELKPLQKIASGGEVSRIMLALKVIFSRVDNIPILIFDEIDTGVGGETVRKIAEKLEQIGENVQVLCITHSPVIASKAREQFYIEKKIYNEKTVAVVRKLAEEERVLEISRMLAGENITEAVSEHAKELLYK
ncbi:MAG: DNA repair protein RecN [Fusobacterium sp.]